MPVRGVSVVVSAVFLYFGYWHCLDDLLYQLIIALVDYMHVHRYIMDGQF